MLTSCASGNGEQTFDLRTSLPHLVKVKVYTTQRNSLTNWGEPQKPIFSPSSLLHSIHRIGLQSQHDRLLTCHFTYLMHFCVKQDIYKDFGWDFYLYGIDQIVKVVDTSTRMGPDLSVPKYLCLFEKNSVIIYVKPAYDFSSVKHKWRWEISQWLSQWGAMLFDYQHSPKTFFVLYNFAVQQ